MNPNPHAGRPGHDTEDHSPKRRRLEYGERNRLRREEYTVGWISALPLEMAAARGMMDEIHDECERSDGDNNAYILGSIAGHNCVVACLPAGVYGIVSATTVASAMRFTFPSLDFWLMVGVGGGAPTNSADIRLGDVVVSMPTPRHHAVVQYDHGKTVANRRFEYTGSLNRPPSSLLMAVSKLQAESRVDSKSYIPQCISEMLRQHPDMRERYSSPGPEQDILFESEYEHEGDYPTCNKCDGSRIVVRSTRISAHPIIHYGTIASGSQVIKHAQTRDRLARELGALCFEMEAAGLMNDFPCLVIRGICDYSDSHKNKKWQEYAAATATAYAKELLHHLPSADGNNPSRESEKKEKRKCCIDSLKFSQIQARHDSIKAAHNRTCGWFLQHEKYQLWLDSSKVSEHQGFLWIKGKPGTGKSTIMKYALQHAEEIYENENAAVISFFFNARGEDLEKSTIGMYRSLLVQLFQNVPASQCVIDHMKILPGQGSQEFNWTVVKLQDLFRRAIEMIQEQTVICFIDALDECPEDEIRDMVDFLSDLNADTCVSPLHVCLSSRHYPHISFNRGLELVLESQQGHEQDLAFYLNSRFSAIEKESCTVNEVKPKVLAKASGIFLWLVFAVDELRKAYDRGGMTGLQRRLRELPMGLSELFRDILTRDRENLEDMVTCIQWILFATYPLSLKQLYHAIKSRDTSEVIHYEIPGDKDSMKKFILGSSKGLAEVTRSRKATVQFIHESVPDFLKCGGMHTLLSELPISMLQTGHELLKQCCYNYIQRWEPETGCRSSIGQDSELEAESEDNSDFFDCGPSIDSDDEYLSGDKLIVPQNSFLRYASRCVLYHADKAQHEGVPQIDFLKSFPWQRWIVLFNNDLAYFTPCATPIYIFAYLDLPNLIKAELLEEMHFHVRGQPWNDPIVASLSQGNSSSLKEFLNLIPHNAWYRDDMKKLLREDFGLSRSEASLSKAMRPLLSYLIRNGYDLCLELLLGTGLADLTVRDDGGMSPLHVAVYTENLHAVNMLLNAGSNPDLVDTDKRTPLFLAARRANIPILSSLLSANADPNMGNARGETPLMAAQSSNDFKIIEMLLAGGANIDAVDNQGQTALIKATSHFQNLNASQSLDTISLLVANGADINAVDIYGRTPLSRIFGSVVQTKRIEIIKFLVANGANIQLIEQPKECPLLRSIQGHQVELLEVLLNGKSGKAYHIQWTDEMISAVADAGPALIRSLLDHGLPATPSDSHGVGLVSSAIVNRNVTILQVLLDRGLGLNSADGQGYMPLHISARELNPAITLFLLKYANVNPTPRDNKGRTPILIACDSARANFPESDRKLEEVLRILLEHGADATATGVDGRTALELYPYQSSQSAALLQHYGCSFR